MTIAIDCRVLQDGSGTGVARYTRGLLDALFVTSNPHTWYLVTTGWVRPTFPSAWQASQIHHVHIGIPNKILNFFLLIFRIPRLDWFLPEKIDLWYAPNLEITAVSPQVPFALTVHDLSFLVSPHWFSPKGRLWHRAVRPRRSIARATRVFVPSHHTAVDIRTILGVPLDRLSVISPGVSSSKFVLPPRDQAGERPYILSVGTLEPRKNIGALLRAFQKAELDRAGFDLVVVGGAGWGSRGLKKEIATSPHVRYLGYVDDEALASLYARAHLFVYPSLYEGFGFPPLEAMVWGIPTIVSVNTSLPEVCGDGAYYVDPKNVDELAEAMTLLVSSVELRARYGERGRARASTFTWEKMAKEFLHEIERV